MEPKLSNTLYLLWYKSPQKKNELKNSNSKKFLQKWVTGPQVYSYVDFSIKIIVSTETNLTSTASCCFYVYLRRNSKQLGIAHKINIGFN